MDVKIDKLKLCYKIKENGLIQKLREGIAVDVDWDFIGFTLRKIEGTHYDFIYEIVYKDFLEVNSNEVGEQVFGTISWGLRTRTDDSFNGFAWLAVDNKQFYLPSDNKVDNRLIHLDYISDVLGLEWNNFTNMDLAVDGSTNFSKKIIQLLRDTNYIPIINGVKMVDRENLIEDILYIGIGNLKRIKEYTLLVRQKKAERNKSAGLSMMAYNKSREIAHNPKKEYISQAYKNSKRLYRLEVRINSDSMKAFLEHEHLSFSGEMLYNKDYLWLFFLTFLNRIVRFQSVKGRKVYGLLDLI